MSGHSKWSTIKHKKAATDAKRGKLFTKIIKEITVARAWAAATPRATRACAPPSCASARQQLPGDNIDRADQEGHGRAGGRDLRRDHLRGLRPGRAWRSSSRSATDNRNRTARGDPPPVHQARRQPRPRPAASPGCSKRRGYFAVERGALSEDAAHGAGAGARRRRLLRRWRAAARSVTAPEDLHTVQEALEQRRHRHPPVESWRWCPRPTCDLRGQARDAGAAPDGGAGGPRRRAEGLGQLRHRHEDVLAANGSSVTGGPC